MTNDEHGQTGIAEDSGLPEESEEIYSDYFSTPARQGLLQQLLHLIRFGDGIPVVQGSGRSGKTSLARELISQLADVPHLALVEVKAGAQFLDVLVQTLHQYGFGVEGGASEVKTTEGELLAELRRFNQALINDQKLGVLVLDNTHNLDDQSLGAVVSLLQGAEAAGHGLHLVLFAQPDLVSRIDDLELLDISVYDFDVPLMSPSELSDFLKKHLESRKKAGGKLSAETIQSIWSRSRGAPGYSLRLMWETAQSGSATEPKSLLKSMPLGHAVALSVLAIVLVWALLLRDTDTEEPERIVSEVALGADPSVSSPEVQPEPDSRLQQANFQSSVPEEKESIKTDVANPEPVESDSKTKPESEIEKAAEKIVAVVSGNTDDEKRNSEIVEEPARPVQKAVPTTALSPPPVSVEVVPNVELQKSSYTADEKFLLDQSPTSYTLQIMAASKKDALERFIGSQPNRDSLFLYRGQRGGKAWFIVTAGIYPSRDAATTAIMHLPAEQKKGGPWPRQLRNIHEDIAADRSK